VPWPRATQRFTGSTSQVEPCLLLAFWISLQLPTPVAPPIVPAQTSTGESDGWRLRSQPHHRGEPIKRATAGFGLPGNVSDRGEDDDNRSATCPGDLPWRRLLPPIGCRKPAFKGGLSDAGPAYSRDATPNYRSGLSQPSIYPPAIAAVIALGRGSQVAPQSPTGTAGEVTDGFVGFLSWSVAACPTNHKASGAARHSKKRVSDGIRTRDRRDHNPELYQLSYAHQVGMGV
jgi:hypothetical protein